MNRDKKRIRKEILGKRGALTEREVREHSLLIKEKLFGLREFKDAKLIMFYVSFRNEVRTEEMIEEAMASGKKIALPVTTPKKDMKPYLVFNLREDLAPGRFGIPEPKERPDRKVNAKDIDMIVVPGVAFDREGGRIGFGQGFYDRFLNGTVSFCVGLAFELQVVETLPLEKYDETLDAIITERQIYAAE